MGQKISSVLENIRGIQHRKINLFSLDAAGKTTILYQLKLGEVVAPVPTNGFNVEDIYYKKFKFTIWDFGGPDKTRIFWKHYCPNSSCIVFVVDSTDTHRIDIAREELHKLLSLEVAKGIPLLVLANKQDIALMTVDEIAQKLELSKLRGIQWHILGTCAISGTGLYEGLDWICKILENQ